MQSSKLLHDEYRGAVLDSIKRAAAFNCELPIRIRANHKMPAPSARKAIMKQHLILNALVWFLVVPNTFVSSSEKAIQWANAERFDTREQCESARRFEQGQARSDLDSGQQKSLGSTDPLTPQMKAVALRWLQAKCARSSETFPPTQTAPGTATKTAEVENQSSTGKAKTSVTSTASNPGQDWCGRRPHKQ